MSSLSFEEGKVIKKKCNEAYFLAREYLKNKRYVEFLKKIEDALYYFNLLGSGEPTRIYNLLGHYHLQKGDCFKSAGWFKKSGSVYDLSGLINVNPFKLFKNKKYIEAENLFKVKIICEIDNVHGSIVGYINKLGKLYLEIGKPKLALSYLQLAKILGEPRKRAIRIALQLSNGIEEQDDIIKLVYIKKSYIINKKNNEPKVINIENLLKGATKYAKMAYPKYDPNNLNKYSRAYNYPRYRANELPSHYNLSSRKICKNCGKEYFVVNSIKELYWNYCYECSLSAFRGAYKKQKTKENMIKDLRELVECLGFVPPKNYLASDGSPSQFIKKLRKKKKIQKIVPIMVDILPAEVYDLMFGSWLKALVESGVLEDGAREGTFGYMCLAKDGHECLSLAEKIIDDWLYDHQIPHQIEPHYPFDYELNPGGGLRADWRVGKVLVEFFGLMGQKEYDEKTLVKKELVKKHEIDLVAIFPDDLYNLEKKLGKFRLRAGESDQQE